MLACANPYYIHNLGLYVGCGSCVACARKRSSAWSLRVVKDIEYRRKKRRSENGSPTKSLTHSDCYYITLTYSDKCLPIKIDEKGNVVRGHGDGFLHRPDLTKFIKRFRSHIARRYNMHDVRVLGSGEYGPNSTHRPHYHLIVWNAPSISYSELQELVQKSWSEYDRRTKEYTELYGNIKASFVADAGDVASYVSKVTSYVTKNGISEYCKQPGETNADFCERTGKLTVPFITASHGIGLDYFSENAEEISRLGFCNSNGFKVSIPRYFLDRVCDYVGRDHFKYKVSRFLNYCRRKGLDVGCLSDRGSQIALQDYMYYKSLLRNYKRVHRARLTRAMDECGIDPSIRSVMYNGDYVSDHNWSAVAQFLLEYGSSYDIYSDFVVKHRFFISCLERSQAVLTYNRLMRKIHADDGPENIVQRYKNKLEKEKKSAYRSECRQRERYMAEAYYSLR